MESTLPQRKKNRLTDYDYSAAGAYFITICTQNRRCLFWQDVGSSRNTEEWRQPFSDSDGKNCEKQRLHIAAVGATIGRPSEPMLSHYGHIADEAIRHIPRHYPSVSVDAYTVMPNHIHILLRIRADRDGRAMPAPTISTVIQQTKGYVTKRIGHPIWQRSYHDHIVRDKADYDAIWEYIADNPRRWREDTLYCE